MMQKRVLHPGTDAGFHVFDVDGRFVLARMLLQVFYLAGTLGDQPVHIQPRPAPRAVALAAVAGITAETNCSSP